MRRRRAIDRGDYVRRRSAASAKNRRALRGCWRHASPGNLRQEVELGPDFGYAAPRVENDAIDN
jgi:hypothetical protein